MILIAAVLLALLLVNAGCELAIRGMHLACALGGTATPASAAIVTPAWTPASRPFISVHVATHNEPPALVIATLASLACSLSADYEVIILDNNTADEALWRPVAAAAARLGPRFRFIHRDGLTGAKAGALNAALALCDPRTTHVAVVDADYQVSADFLSDAIAALTAASVDYVQFPQAYRGVSPHAAGVERELGDYFAGFASHAGRPAAMLPTGTLSLFDVAALRAIGGWSAATITEDAEIGVRLQAAGYRGLWVGRTRGHGLLPLDFAGLRIQRARWAAGNFQVLRHALTERQLPPALADVIRLIVQLTAWLSLWGLPAVALALIGLFPGLPLAQPIAGTAGATICASAALTAARMAAVGGNGEHRASSLRAFATKLALTWTSATAWLPALVGRQLRFRRTQKAVVPGAGDNAELSLALASLAYAALALVYAARSQPVETLACALLVGVWPAARMVDRNLKASARLNPELA